MFNRRDGPTVSGALVKPKYLVRRTRYVAVNEADLDELLTYNVVHKSLFGLGIALFSGPFWVLASYLIDRKDITFGIDTLALGAISLCGAVLLAASLVIFSMRQKKVRKIFDETEEIDTDSIVA